MTNFLHTQGREAMVGHGPNFASQGRANCRFGRCRATPSVRMPIVPVGYQTAYLEKYLSKLLSLLPLEDLAALW